MDNFPPFIQEIMRDNVGKVSWYHPGVFGRFLLADAFPECDHFLYLDNDMFMNIDVVSEVFEKVSLTRKDRRTGLIVPTHIGLHFETCPQSSRIRVGQFNNSHPFVRQMGLHHIKYDQYVNNGIWVVNATTWRNENVTDSLWAAVLLAQTEPVIVSNGKVNRRPDDQKVTFLVQGVNATHLPAHLNIRNTCEKFAHSFHRQGIIHLAGAKKVCSAFYPVKPMALMTSIVHSLSSVCNISPRLLADCNATMKLFKTRNISFQDQGLGGFNFPPASNFTFLSNPVAKGVL
jgi:lipopolysaccharide biosynthesis glycosyltransferase